MERGSTILRLMVLHAVLAAVNDGIPLWSGFRNGGSRLGVGTISGMIVAPAQKLTLGPAAAASPSNLPANSGKTYTIASTFTSSPAIGDDGRIFAAFGDGTVRAFIPSGAVNWTYTGTVSFYSSPQLDAANARLFICASDGTVLALSTKSGGVLWSFLLTGPCGTSPALAKDESRLYFGGAGMKSQDNTYFGLVVSSASASMSCQGAFSEIASSIATAPSGGLSIVLNSAAQTSSVIDCASGSVYFTVVASSVTSYATPVCECR